MNENHLQTPHFVPQAFSNITKLGYRNAPPAKVQQKELVKLQYMARENISIDKFLSTFGMASESCLNNLRVSRDQQEKLFDQFIATQDGPTREQIMLQLYQITQQEASRMQFMLDISRSMSKAYANLVANFISSLTNLVLLRRDAYICHAYPNLDPKHSGCVASASHRVGGKTRIQKRPLPPLQETQEGQRWTASGPSGRLLPINAGTPIIKQTL